MTEKIQIRIGPDGRIEAETLGMKGEECTDVISLLERLLDAKAQQPSLKPEYYETEIVSLTETLKRGE